MKKALITSRGERVYPNCGLYCGMKASYITGVTLRVDGGLILPDMPEGSSNAENGWS